MASDDSALNALDMQRARALLAQPGPRERIWPAVAAAGALAVSSLVLATAMILAPPTTTHHAVRPAPG